MPSILLSYQTNFIHSDILEKRYAIAIYEAHKKVKRYYLASFKSTHCTKLNIQLNDVYTNGSLHVFSLNIVSIRILCCLIDIDFVLDVFFLTYDLPTH